MNNEEILETLNHYSTLYCRDGNHIYKVSKDMFDEDAENIPLTFEECKEFGLSDNHYYVTKYGPSNNVEYKEEDLEKLGLTSDLGSLLTDEQKTAIQEEADRLHKAYAEKGQKTKDAVVKYLLDEFCDDAQANDIVKVSKYLSETYGYAQDIRDAIIDILDYPDAKKELTKVLGEEFIIDLETGDILSPVYIPYKEYMTDVKAYKYDFTAEFEEDNEDDEDDELIEDSKYNKLYNRLQELSTLMAKYENDDLYGGLDYKDDQTYSELVKEYDRVNKAIHEYEKFDKTHANDSNLKISVDNEEWIPDDEEDVYIDRFIIYHNSPSGEEVNRVDTKEDAIAELESWGRAYYAYDQKTGKNYKLKELRLLKDSIAPGEFGKTPKEAVVNSDEELAHEYDKNKPVYAIEYTSDMSGLNFFFINENRSVIEDNADDIIADIKDLVSLEDGDDKLNDYAKENECEIDCIDDNSGNLFYIDDTLYYKKHPVIVIKSGHSRF